MDQFDFAEKIARLSVEQVERNQESWARVEKLFRQFSTVNYTGREVAPVYELIKSVMITDFTKLFRAGHSMWTLIISTETEEHFVSHQPFVAIDLEDDILQIRYRHTNGNVLLPKEACEANINGLRTLEPYLARLWSETHGRG